MRVNLITVRSCRHVWGYFYSACVRMRCFFVVKTTHERGGLDYMMPGQPSGPVGKDHIFPVLKILRFGGIMAAQELPHLLWLAKRMMGTIRCNMSFSMALNFVAILLAIGGILNPVVGALVHNAGSVLVIINSAFLLHWKKKA